MEKVQKLARDERETACVYNEADGYWTVYTAVKKHMNKFDKLGWECTDVEYYPDGEVMSKSYKVPTCAISFRSPEKKKRNLTEEQRREIAERLRTAQKSKE